MDAEEALNQIKDAEYKVEEITRLASIQAQKIISQAKIRAEELIKNGENLVRAERIPLIKEEVLACAKIQIQKIDEKKQETKNKIKEMVLQNIDKTVEWVIEQLIKDCKTNGHELPRIKI